jgi:hypothetical protein
MLVWALYAVRSPVEAPGWNAAWWATLFRVTERERWKLEETFLILILSKNVVNLFAVAA